MKINRAEKIHSIPDFRTKTNKRLKSLNKKKVCAGLLELQASQHQLDWICLAEKILWTEQEIQRGKSLSQSQVEKLSKTWIK